MILSPNQREELFNECREIHLTLGNLFQNSMDITPEMVDQELAELQKHEFNTSLLRSKLSILKRNVATST